MDFCCLWNTELQKAEREVPRGYLSCVCPLAGGGASWARGDCRAGTAIASPAQPGSTGSVWQQPPWRGHIGTATWARPPWHGHLGTATSGRGVPRWNQRKMNLPSLLYVNCLITHGKAAVKQEREMQPSSCFAWGFGVEGATEIPLPLGDHALEAQEITWIKKRTQGIMLFQAREGREIALPFSSLSCLQQENYILCSPTFQSKWLLMKKLKWIVARDTVNPLLSAMPEYQQQKFNVSHWFLLLGFLTDPTVLGTKPLKQEKCEQNYNWKLVWSLLGEWQCLSMAQG